MSLKITPLLLLTLAPISEAALTIYSAEASSLTAISAMGSSAIFFEEDFNSFVADTSLNTAIAFDGFNASGNAPLTRVDVAPFQTTTQHPINGTPYIYGSLSPASQNNNRMDFTFAAETFAFGATFADTNTIGNGTRLTFSTGNTANLPSLGLTEQFFDVISSTPFTSA